MRYYAYEQSCGNKKFLSSGTNKTNNGNIEPKRIEKQLLEYIADKYGVTEQLEQTGTINLSKTFKDLNNNGALVEVINQIVQNFVHKDDSNIDYNKPINIGGKYKLTLNEILNLDYSTKFIEFYKSMYNNSYLKEVMFTYLCGISEAFQYVDSDVVKNVMNTFIEYYSCIVQAAFGDERVFMYDTVINPFNYITGKNQPDRMNQWIAKEIYGVQSLSGQKVVIDIKALIERFLDFAKSAGLYITNESQNGNDNSSDGGQDSDDGNEKFNTILG